MRKPSSPLAESVRTRLTNLSRQSGDNYQTLLTRYALERLLYRLSQSAHAERFVLKGAALYPLWARESKDLPYRPTRDLDFLGSGDPSVEGVLSAMREVLGQAVEPDAVEFDVGSLRGQRMREAELYEGCRLGLDATLGTAKIRVQMDFGFGDAITPAPRLEEYPTLLAFPAPRLRTYPRETVVAEKFEAMVSLGLLNTRMKDFFDVWLLQKHFAFDGDMLAQAVRNTFGRRQTALPTDLPLAFTPQFTADPAKIMAWRAFEGRAQIRNLPALDEVVAEVQTFLWPIAQAAAQNLPWPRTWMPGQGWNINGV